MELLIIYLFDEIIICLEITALGYRWTIGLIVVDTVCWLGKTETNHVEYVIEYDDYIEYVYWLIIVYDKCLNTLHMYLVCEEIGDVRANLFGRRYGMDAIDN